MNDVQLQLLILGVYILFGYAFLRLLLWVSMKSIEHEPNPELATYVAMVEGNVFIRIFMVTFWPVIIVGATLNWLIDRLTHKH